MQINKAIKIRLSNVLAADKTATEKFSYPFKKDVENLLASYIALSGKPLIDARANDDGMVEISIAASGWFIK